MMKNISYGGRRQIGMWQRMASCVLGLVAFSPVLPAAESANPPVLRRVCLVSGSNDSAPYRTDATLRSLADYLRQEGKMEAEVLVLNPAGTGFDGIERLLEADAAVFFVRRKTLDAHNLAVIRRFFDSGKGFVALRSTSHAWENWPNFDAEILGATYGRNGTGNFGNAERITFRPHPIWEGVGPMQPGEPVSTRKDIYRYGEFAADLNVILEGETKNGRMPLAWTRERDGRRLFYVGLGYAEEVESAAFRRMVRNALHWVTRTAAPAANAADAAPATR